MVCAIALSALVPTAFFAPQVVSLESLGGPAADEAEESTVAAPASVSESSSVASAETTSGVGGGRARELHEPLRVPEDRLPERFSQAVLMCRDRGPNCSSLLDLKRLEPGIYRDLRAWCAPHKDAGDVLCQTVNANVDEELAAITVDDLLVLRSENLKITRSCSGFGLVVPLVGIRRLAKDNVVLGGPLEVGLGGGYHFGLVCADQFSVGWDVFAYSEGLNPGTVFHIGAGTGPAMSVANFVRFGFSLGYDFFRSIERNGVSTTNGLLSYKRPHSRDLSWLVTLAVPVDMGTDQTP